MRSRTSQGVPEWSGGKDLYIGSPVSAIGTSFGVIGIVPGPPEGSGGPPGGVTSPGGLHGPIVGRDQPLGGLGRVPPRPKAPPRGEGANPRLRWA